MKYSTVQSLKRKISGLIALAMMTGLLSSMPVMAEDETIHVYSGDGYEVKYDIKGGWGNTQNIEVTLTNTGDEPLLNWALKYDAQGTIEGLWNGTVYDSEDNCYIIKNSGYNYEIIPDAFVTFGYSVTGSDLQFPDTIELCSERTERIADDYTVSMTITDDWEAGFSASVTIQNLSAVPLEAWRLAFDTNFTIDTLWNAQIISQEGNHYVVANDVTTTPIGPYESKTFSFKATRNIAENSELQNCSMSEISINDDFSKVNTPDPGDDSGSEDDSSNTDSGDTDSGDTDGGGDDSSSQGDSKDDEDIDPDALILSAFGDYLADTNSVNIEWYGTYDEGVFDIWQSDDNEEYEKVATVEDGSSYLYQITDDCEKIFFKVSQTINDKYYTESYPFILVKSDNGYSVEFNDADGDGLLDISEDMLGTDKTLPDTDNDGLTDYEEISFTDTDPNDYDSAQEGIADAEADLDNDNLSNAEEIKYNTDPTNSDTDEDGLIDGDEVKTYLTDPLDPDTDGDGISDADELLLGLDPLLSTSDGVHPDGEREFEQHIDADSEVLKEINTDSNPYSVSLDIVAAGYAESAITADISGYSNVIQNESVLGNIPMFIYEDGLSVESVKINYEISDEYTDNVNGKYADVNDAFSGIKRLNVFKYFEDIDMLLPIETFYDEENNIVYTEVDEFGTYCLIDMEIWLEKLGADPIDLSNDPSDIITSQLTDSANLVALMAEDQEVSENLDVVFFTFASTEEKKERDSNNILKAAELLFNEYGTDGKLHIYISIYTGTSIPVLSTGAEYASNLEELQDMLTRFPLCTVDQPLEYTTNNFFNKTTLREDSDKYFFFIESKIITTTRLDAIINRMQNNQIKASVISAINDHEALAVLTDGTYINKIDDYSDDVYKYITEQHGIAPKDPEKTYNTVLGFNFKRIELDSPILPEYYDLKNSVSANKELKDELLQSKNYADTDSDELFDFEEIRYTFGGTQIITWDDNGKVVLPTIEDCMKLKYAKEYVKRAFENIDLNPYIISKSLNDIRILPVSSDPTTGDTDGDSLLDGQPIFTSAGIPVAPEDPDPYDASDNGMWKAHIDSMFSDTVSTEYDIKLRNEIYKDAHSLFEYVCSTTHALPTSQEQIHYLVANLLLLKTPINLSGVVLGPIVRSFKPIIKECPQLAEIILLFVQDTDGQAYHSQVDTWQRKFGYNDLYDDVFRIGSDMLNGKLMFEYNDTQYVLWMWKGDYWNLKSGAEIGLYKKAFDYITYDHYDAVDFELPMTLSLYEYFYSDNIINYYHWAPKEDQWWITGFDTNEEFIKVNPLRIIGSIDFSGDEELYNAIKTTYNKNDKNDYEKISQSNIICDDSSHIIWVLW